MFSEFVPAMSEYKLYFKKLHDFEDGDLTIILCLIELIFFVESDFVVVAAVVHLQEIVIVFEYVGQYNFFDLHTLLELLELHVG